MDDVKQNIKPLNELDAKYLEQLNMDLLYAQKAYVMALNHFRRVYQALESDGWVLNNIGVGFEKIQ